ncbi:MAG TPA: protease complex subunit PrcB family protein [Gemmataceae bacterium]|nr:protease complex subunit PrcB family protein [Gemmataceae bacterium]
MKTTLLLSMLLAAPPGSDAENQKDIKEVKIEARAVWPVQEEKPVQRVIRSGEELAVALGVDPPHAKEKKFQTGASEDTAKLLKVKNIDWSKQMLVIVAAGEKRTGGYRMEILSLRAKADRLIVNWKLHSPPPGTFVTQAISYPAQMVLVERFQGAVCFDPPVEKK